MSFSNSARTIVLTLSILITLTASAVADTLLVPGDFATIQEAIDNAADGDTVLVDDGTFAEALEITVPNLTLLSVNGFQNTTLSASPGPFTPIVRVSAPGFTLGAAGQGFTLVHEEAGAASVIEVDGGTIGQPGASDANPLTINSNELIADGAVKGIHFNSRLMDVDVAIVGNLLSPAAGASFSFTDAILFEASGPQESLYTVNLEIRDNTIQLFENTGIRNLGHSHTSSIVINNNSLVGQAGSANYGVEFPETVDVRTTLNVTNNDISDVEYGVFVDYLYDGAVVNATGNSIVNFHNKGIEVERVYYGSHAVISGNVLEGDSNGANYGVENYYLDEGCTLKIDDNTISGVSDTGIFHEYSYYTQTLTINNNTIDLDNGSYGIYIYHHAATNLECNGNAVTGFVTYGINVDDELTYGSSAEIVGNTLSGTGSDSGIYVSGSVSEGTELLIDGNTVSGFNRYGIHVPTVDGGSKTTISNNTVTADPAGTNTDGVYTDTVENGSEMEVLGNTIDMTGSDGNGVYHYTTVYGSTTTVSDNQVTNYRESGLYISSTIEYGSSLEVADNTFEGDPIGQSRSGVYLNDYVQYGSDLWITGNIIRDFTEDGIYVYTVSEGSDAICDDNVISGSDSGAESGIEIEYFYYGALASSISGNTVSNIRDSSNDGMGIYVYQLYEGCFVDMIGNTVNAHADGATKGVCLAYIEYGSILNLDDNTVAGFGTALAMTDYISDAAILNVNRNLFEATENGVQFEGYISTGGEASFADNTITGFSGTGFQFLDDIDTAVLKVERNLVSGNSAAAAVEMTLIEKGAIVEINDNCFTGTTDGVVVDSVETTAQLILRGNDLSDVTGDAVKNLNSDATHAVDAEDNFLNGKPVSGEVLVARELASAPDLDGDGVPNCIDVCSNTPAGAAVDADGCAIFVQDPSPTPGGGNNDPEPPAETGPCGGDGGSTGTMLLPATLLGAGGMRRRRTRRTA